MGQKPPTCGVCHTENAWSPSTVSHTWPLTGAHAQADCFACHRGDPVVFAGTPSSCWRCHEADYRRVRFAAHARFAHACHDCHSTAAWHPAHEGPAHEGPPASEAPPARPPRIAFAKCSVV